MSMNNLSWSSKVWISVLGLAVVALLGLTLNAYQDLMSIKVAIPKVSKIKSVSQGGTVAVTFKISKDIPAVKIEICRDSNKTTQCKSLADKVIKSAATVRIPADYPLGKAVIKVTNRDTKNKPTNIVQSQMAVTITKATPTSEPESGGGGSGGGGGNGGGSGGPSSDVNNKINSSPPLVDEEESDGRKIIIQSNHSELIAGQTERITVTYRLNHWPGTYNGVMQIITQPFQGMDDISNISSVPTRQSEIADKWGSIYFEMPYSIPNGQSQSFAFDIKVPAKGYKGQDTVVLTAQIKDSYGPQYLNQDGTAPQGPINVSRGNEAKWAIR